jgi:hypothetical protein
LKCQQVEAGPEPDSQWAKRKKMREFRPAAYILLGDMAQDLLQKRSLGLRQLLELKAFAASASSGLEVAFRNTVP